MARGPFPGGDFGRSISPGLVGGAVGAPGAGGAAAVAGAAREFGGRLRKLADDTYEREGLADAAKMIGLEQNSGVTAALRPGQGVDDQAYNTAIRAQHLTNRQAAYDEELNKIEVANPDSELRFIEAHTAVSAAFQPTGDPETDLAFSRFKTLADVQALQRVRSGQERVRVETVRGAYVSTSATAGTALGQTIVSAGLDDQGAQLVGASLNQYASQLAAFGPREAFSVGGIDFPADPTRAGVVSAEKLAVDFDRAQAEARATWILAAGERAPDAMAKLAFAGQVQERWAAGDPMFAGLGPTEMRQIVRGLESDAASAASGERAAANEAAERARQLLKAGEYGGEVAPDELRGAARMSGDPGLMAEVEFALTNGFDVTPASLKSDAVSVGAVGVMDLLLDNLEGPGFVGNDNGRGRAQFGITEASHPAAWRDGRVDRAEAEAIYRRDYLAPLGQLSPEMQIVALPAAVVGGVETARALLAQAGGDPERFLQLETQRFQRLARENPAKYGDDLAGWMNRVGKVRAALQAHRGQVRAQEGFTSDPIGFARGGGRRAALLPVVGFDPGAVFGGDVASWGAAMRSRRATGQELAREYSVPARILSDDEEDFYKARFAQDPGAILTFTTAAAQALGADGAREVLGQLGRNPGQAGADLHMATLALDAGGQAFAAQAAEGRRLLASGAQGAKFETNEGLEDVQRTVASAYRTMPDIAGPVLATARAAAAADAARGEQRPADHYVQSALGRNPYNGKFYGGVAEVNGAQTLLPSWVRQDAMDEVVGWVARSAVAGNWGPVFDNGQPIPVAGLAQMRPEMQAGGQYRLRHPRTNQYVPGRDGRPFEFNIDTEERHAALRRQFPDLIRPRR